MNIKTKKAVVVAELEKLRDDDGRLTAEQVYEAARNKRHPLHKEFIWDDKKAAYEQRIARANELIRYATQTVIRRDVKIEVPCYVRDPDKAGNEAGMISLTSADLDKQQSEKIMLAELDRCESAIVRARAVVSFLDKTHPGLAIKLEEMLAAIVHARTMLKAA